MRQDCYVAINFDGTCVEHNYPKVGMDIGADPWLRAAVALKAKLILNTSRCGPELGAAIDWFEDHDVKLWDTNNNPEQYKWTKSAKLYAHIYVESTALGAPMNPRTERKKPHMNWDLAGPMLLRRIAGILNQ